MKPFNFSSFPELKTDRLFLRQLTLEDSDVILKLRSSEEINKFVATKRMQNLDEAVDFINVCNNLFEEKNRIFWAIQLNGQIIGTIVLHHISTQNKYAEIGYKLDLEHLKKGFMSEAMQKVLEFGFQEMNLKTIEAFTHKNNTPSKTLLEKHNFVFQKERRDKGFDNNRIFLLENN
jgi:ribosomal-protein-alanine N-acetyltransferase